MQLVYEDRTEMQKSLRRSNIREVFIRLRTGTVVVTAVIDSRSMVYYETMGGPRELQDEMAQWKDEHFEVVRGEVMLDRGKHGPAGMP